MNGKLVGHGPDPGFRPYVPDFILLERDGSVAAYSRKGLALSPPPGMARCEPFELLDGLWPCVGRERVEPFELSGEAAFRAAVARGLVAAQRDPDPARALDSMRAAAAMAGVNLDSVLAEIEADRRPGESLADAYVRRRKA